MDQVTLPIQSKFINADTSQRIIFDFQNQVCCGKPKGLLDDFVRQGIPQQLEFSGITQEQWELWMKQLDEIQPKQFSICCLVLGAIPTYGFCFGCIPIFRWSSYQQAMRQWQDDINKEIKPYGLYIKTQTQLENQSCDTSKGKPVRFEKSILSIALNAHESEKLKNEPHIVLRRMECCQKEPDSCMCPLYKDRVV